MKKIGISGTMKKLKEDFSLSLSSAKLWLCRQTKKIKFENLKRNWFFSVSAMAFFCVSATLTLGYILAMAIAFVASVMISSYIPSIRECIKKNSSALRIFSGLTSIGICLSARDIFYANWSISSKTQALKEMFPVAIDVPAIVSLAGSIIAVYFVYSLVLLFWAELKKIFSETKMFDDIKKAEWIIYGLIFAATLAFMIFSFTSTEVFYGTDRVSDVVYTSDSSALVKANVYMALTHPENDLRQPLFAVFCAPFVGIPYLFGRLIGSTECLKAIILNGVQIIMLFAANLMLTKILKLNALKRSSFMILTSCIYSQLLFILMMEQYIVAYFWLILCMYLILERRKYARFAFWGAGGTLMTGLILMPMVSDKSLTKNFKEWFADMIRYGCEFIAILLIFCRFDVIFNLTDKVSTLSNFTGRNLTVLDKFYQYTEFVGNCFRAPDAGVNATNIKHVSWQLNTVTDVSILGVIILALVIVSGVWNRNKKSSLLAFGWVCFSVVMLLGLGWGTKENGLILYSLYFGWAFLVLLFQLVEKIEDKLKVRFIVPVVCIGAAIILAAINIPAIIEVVNFGISFYPA